MKTLYVTLKSGEERKINNVISYRMNEHSLIVHYKPTVVAPYLNSTVRFENSEFVSINLKTESDE